MGTRDEMTIHCPECGKQTTIMPAEWNKTYRVDTIWNGRTRDYERLPGPDAPIRCPHCARDYPARDWHRELERREFERNGWFTPRMQRETGKDTGS